MLGPFDIDALNIGISFFTPQESDGLYLQHKASTVGPKSRVLGSVWTNKMLRFRARCFKAPERDMPHKKS